jgi:phage terminase large subunit GpA-like protein
MDAEQVKQLVAEELVTIKDRRGFSRMEWQRRRPNEQLDLAVYARAALSVLGSDRYGERFWARFESADDKPVVHRIAEQVPASPGYVGPVYPAPSQEGATMTTAEPPRSRFKGRLAGA